MKPEFGDRSAAGSQPRPEAMPSPLALVMHGHAAFQFLHAGCVLGVFDRLQRTPGYAPDALVRALGLSAHGGRVLLFGLRSLGLIQQNGDSVRNGPDIDAMFERREWDVFRATVRFHAEIVYPGELGFVASLQRGENAGVGFAHGNGRTLYERLATQPSLKAVFYEYMSQWTRYALRSLLAAVDFDSFTSVLDVGGGDGTAAIAIAEASRRPVVTVLELPSVVADVQRLTESHGLGARIHTHAADMFSDPWPTGHDCVLFMHQMVIWNRTQNLRLLHNAHRSLDRGGKVVIVSSMADPDEAGPLMAALDSAYFVAVAAGQGMIYPWTEYASMLQEAGYEDIEFTRFRGWTPHGMVTARRKLRAAF